MTYKLTANEDSFFLTVEGLQVPTNNQSHRAVKGKVIKSSAYREFQRTLGGFLIKEKSIKTFGQKFDSKKQALVLSYGVAIPNMITKGGTIAKNKFDVFNYEKCLTDAIMSFLPNLNDSYILKGLAQKFNSQDERFYFYYVLKITERPEVSLQWPLGVSDF